MTNMVIQWENSLIKFIVQKITKTSLSSSAALESRKTMLSRFESHINMYKQYKFSLDRNLFYKCVRRSISFSIVCFRVPISNNNQA